METMTHKDHINDAPSEDMNTIQDENEHNSDHFYRIPSLPLPGKTVWKIATIK